MDLGRKLPRLARERGLGEMAVECGVPFAEGGSVEVEWLWLTFDQLNERAGGNLLDGETLTRWKAALAQPGRWFASLALVSTRARRLR